MTGRGIDTDKIGPKIQPRLICGVPYANYDKCPSSIEHPSWTGCAHGYGCRKSGTCCGVCEPAVREMAAEMQAWKDAADEGYGRSPRFQRDQVRRKRLRGEVADIAAERDAMQSQHTQLGRELKRARDALQGMLIEFGSCKNQKDRPTWGAAIAAGCGEGDGMTDRAPFYDDDGIPMCESGDCAQYRTVAFGPRDGWCEEQQCDTEDECACFPELKELLAERTALLAKQNKENSDET